MPDKNTYKIFLAYAREDEEMLQELKLHFFPLERSSQLQVWYDGKIEPGAVWEQSIKDHLHQADLILLLISAASIASDYFYNIEVKEALERHNKGLTRVIPLILKPCAWEATPIGQLQALPKDALPVSKWPDRDDAYNYTIQKIWKLIEKEQKKPPQKKNEVLKTPTTNASTAKQIPQSNLSTVAATTSLQDTYLLIGWMAFSLLLYFVGIKLYHNLLNPLLPIAALLLCLVLGAVLLYRKHKNQEGLLIPLGMGLLGFYFFRIFVFLTPITITSEEASIENIDTYFSTIKLSEESMGLFIGYGLLQCLILLSILLIGRSKWASATQLEKLGYWFVTSIWTISLISFLMN
ncbi:MAG: toll/interleukin-1 receptor domain-containing protein [Bacteroidota bacterium]